MKKNHKLTPDVHKQIKEAAKKLPEMQRLDPHSGKPLVQVEISDMEIKGDKKHYKKRLVPVLINHENELILAFKKMGQQGIKAYCEAMIKIDKDVAVEKAYSICITLMQNIERRHSGKMITKDFGTEHDKEWSKKISPISSRFFNLHPQLLTNQDMKNICVAEVDDKYTKLEGYSELRDVLTQYYETLCNISRQSLKSL